MEEKLLYKVAKKNEKWKTNWRTNASSLCSLKWNINNLISDSMRKPIYDISMFEKFGKIIAPYVWKWDEERLLDDHEEIIVELTKQKCENIKKKYTKPSWKWKNKNANVKEKGNRKGIEQSNNKEIYVEWKILVKKDEKR